MREDVATGIAKATKLVGVFAFMAYRDFEGALADQRRALVDEIERLDAERARFQSTLLRRDELFERLRELEKRMGLSARIPSPFWRSRGKKLLAFAGVAGAAMGAAAVVAMPTHEEQPERSLLLMVKYIDRIGTQVESARNPADDRGFGGCHLRLSR